MEKLVNHFKLLFEQTHMLLEFWCDSAPPYKTMKPVGIIQTEKLWIKSISFCRNTNEMEIVVE